ncbi:MAG: IclR family transcriptional regulator, partial [Alphaproteobacteria bacterium]
TLRLLTALEAGGIVEQDRQSRGYHLGPAVLRLARLREASFPLARVAEAILRDLCAATGETALASAISGALLVNIGMVESRSANRIILEPGGTLPFHATASGLAWLAFADDARREEVLRGPLPRFTPATVTDPALLRALLRDIRRDGIARVDGTFEAEVVGLAAPWFEPDGRVGGAVALALPRSRAQAPHESAVTAELRKAARRLTEARGGSGPAG